MNIADVAQHVHALEQKVKEQTNEIERLLKQNQTQALDHIASEGEWWDLIGKKDAEIERLREALKQIASTTKIITFENDQVLAALHLLVLNHLKIARAALKEDE